MPRLRDDSRPSVALRAAAQGIVALVFCSCGARSQLYVDENEAALGCMSSAPTCIVRPQFCEPPATVAAVCDAASEQWSCPSGSSDYRRVVQPSPCLPFVNQWGISTINGWGLSGFSRIPTDDGRCLWVADSVTFVDGSTQRNVAFEADPDLPFGACPEVSVAQPRAITFTVGGVASSLYIEVNGGYRLGGATHVLYRAFQYDPTSAVGIAELGGGIAAFDTANLRLTIPGPDVLGPWGLDLDLGDAHYPEGDGAHELVFGCGSPGGYLSHGCKVARVAADDSLELLSQSSNWIASVRASDGVTVFDSGTWQSSIARKPDGFEHIYVVDYGSSIYAQSASSLLGPWTQASGYGRCDLPASDSRAFCAGPIVNFDLMDPTLPGELPVSYAVGTAGTPTGAAYSYWPRLVWLR